MVTVELLTCVQFNFCTIVYITESENYLLVNVNTFTFFDMLNLGKAEASNAFMESYVNAVVRLKNDQN